ncbi:hypothetical protein Tco_0954468 [Tanacetum coccineum]|uniref:Arginine--tRNA ligase n=1 Tax=Tanacetum coccineum TaxID=301880 RepID=A0ABQ5E3S0_9ASTR
MFTNNQRQDERTRKYGTHRVQYLQELVAQFQNASIEAPREKVAASLANFAYDPFNYICVTAAQDEVNTAKVRVTAAKQILVLFSNLMENMLISAAGVTIAGLQS